ncbi:tail fiber domain-containing protein, partial [Chryseobacterium gambrini]
TTINAGNTKANVGVGYATPQTQLHVGGDARFGLGSGAHTYTNADSSGGAWFDFYTDESTVKSNLSWDNTNSRFNINGMGTKTVINAGTTANVGVGLVNPQSQLDVSTMAQIGLENASGSLDQRVQLGADSGGSYVNFLNAAGAKKTYLWYNQGSARFEIGNTTAEPFLVNAAVGSGPIGLRTVTTTNSLDINVKGAFGISSSGNYTGHTWDGNCSEDVTEIGNGWINSQRNDNANILLVKTNGSTGINNAFIAMKNGTTVQGSITPTSTTAVAFNTTSDLRLKENIKNTDVGITDLMKISVKDYNYKADNTKTKVTGFIAQDLYKIFPNAVTVGGEDAQTNPWQVDYGKLTPLLVKAVQDQQKVIENQNSEISSLKKEIELIKSKLNK